MESLLIYVMVLLAIAIPVMVLYRRHSVRKAEAEMREQRLLQDSVLTGVKTMRGAEHNSRRMPMTSQAAGAKHQKPQLRKVETKRDSSSTDTPDDLMLLSGAHLSTSTHGSPTPASNYDDDNRKLAGGGGTFDGGGSSGDWDRPSSSYSSSSGSSSYDSGSSSSSSSSSDSSSSSSSDSGSSSSSD